MLHVTMEMALNVVEHGERTRATDPKFFVINALFKTMDNNK